MSDEQPPAEAPVAEAAPAEVYTCPISGDFLPDNMKKHVDPKAPVPLRMMAAKGLVPLSPPDMLGVLFMLMYDAEQNVRDTAGKTAVTLPDRIASSGFRDEQVDPPVLGWFLTLYQQNDSFAEMLILNGNTPDSSIASIAATCSKRTAELIGGNQLRLLRDENIIRELAKNPNSEGALIDGVCDFAVRSGLFLADIPHMIEARVRLYGPESIETPPVDNSPTADQVLAEFNIDPDAPNTPVTASAPGEEGKRLSLSQRISKMSIAEKIKLANKGDKECRGILIRDSNKLVAVATIRSSRITDGEVLLQASNRIAHDEVLRVIFSNREWLRKYNVKLALVKNPKVPQGMSMRLLQGLHEADIKSLAKDKNVPGSVQMLAKKHINAKNEPKAGSGH